MGCKKSDFKILNASCYMDGGKVTRMIGFGIEKKDKSKVKAWLKTSYLVGEFRDGMDDLNAERRECGQEKITALCRSGGNKVWVCGTTISDDSDSNSD